MTSCWLLPLSVRDRGGGVGGRGAGVPPGAGGGRRRRPRPVHVAIHPAKIPGRGAQFSAITSTLLVLLAQETA